jgi:flagellum-specific peptidoglycan hydrolase FlgJ
VPPPDALEEAAMKVGPVHAWVNGEHGYAGRAYLFRGDVYYRYDWTPDAAAKGYPLPLAKWKLPGTFGKGFDAALRGAWIYKGMAYLFKGPQYVAYSWKNDAATGDSPRSIAAWGLKGAFAGGIDAAINGEGPMTGKALFIKGSQYVVYDWASDKIEGKPAPLKTLGFPGPFAVSIDCAVEGVGQYAGYAYFFRGDKYIRYEWATGSIDNRYPQQIAGNWKGLAEVLALSPKEASFFNTWIGQARDSQKRHGVPWEVTLAQCAVESGWARFAPGNNAFGVKAGGSWKGAKALRRTREVLAKADHKFPKVHSVTEKQVDGKTMYEYVVDDWFRVYGSVEDSFRDHAAFLEQDNYRAARGVTDPIEFARAIAKAGYATDPNYFNALKNVIGLLQRIQKVVE